MTKIIALVGTNTDRSTNRQLLEFIARYFSDKADIELVEIKDFPAFNKPADGKIPDIVASVADKIIEADALIIGTPEYNHAVPAALQSALEWFSLGKRPLVHKPVMIAGASYGALGSSRAQAQLRQILNAPQLRAVVLPGTEFLLPHSQNAFNESGYLIDTKFIEQLEIIFDNFLVFIEVIKQLPDAKFYNLRETETYNW